MKDAYTYMCSGESYKFGALHTGEEDTAPRTPPWRKRDVWMDAKGKHGEPKPETWEDFEARILRQK